ncbi:amino acid--tRNA ligase-related protein [bacterium]
MKIYHDIEEIPFFENTIITIGTFDGIHLGHQELIRTLLYTAKQHDSRHLLITFNPHPLHVVSEKTKPILLLTTIEEKISIFEKRDLHHVLFMPFTRALADLKDDWETLFHRLFMDKIEPNLGIPQPVFIIDYPQKIGLMARSKSEDSRFVERVELYIAGLELANGYSELTDPNEQLQRFSKQQKIKKDYNSKNYPIDHELIDAMKLGLPNCAGIALGIDRLLMFLLNKTEIQDVILFPF